MAENILNNTGWEKIVKFLTEFVGCKQGRTHGDDTVFYYPGNYGWGVKINTNPKLKKSGYPQGTLSNNIKWLHVYSNGRITRQTWIDWFSKN